MKTNQSLKHNYNLLRKPQQKLTSVRKNNQVKSTLEHSKTL